jgi:protein ImuA
MQTTRADIFKQLQTDILHLQGLKSISNTSLDKGLESIKECFPNGTFPIGAIHEFLTTKSEDVASTTGFVAGLLASLMGNTGATLWISSSRTLFPPALKNFSIDPERFIFLDLQKEKDVIWAMDEALKCSSLSAVVGEMREIDFTASRRLQLAVEQSQVTGFILRKNSRNNINTTACVSRWKIASRPSELKNLPGIGFPKWKVELLRMRNGKSGAWDIQWTEGKFLVDHPDSNRDSSTRTRTPDLSHWEKKKAG